MFLKYLLKSLLPLGKKLSAQNLGEGRSWEPLRTKGAYALMVFVESVIIVQFS